ncbi:hypothetical protein AV530_018054 [Patagioenas fasciata monilis]|uniref:Uncharacterized protein n=1 Tax=Patagioenas fasciata monilis TaxID=372326 RepID=A0A1V4KKM9_PATFA|nr:hypothetical protein AV530_018054 [Patagioenas fasciata monilis]
MLGDLFEVGLSTRMSTQELQQEGEAKLLNYFPGSKPNSWGKLSDRIQEEELRLRKATSGRRLRREVPRRLGTDRGRPEPGRGQLPDTGPVGREMMKQ